MARERPLSMKSKERKRPDELITGAQTGARGPLSSHRRPLIPLNHHEGITNNFFYLHDLLLKE